MNKLLSPIIASLVVITFGILFHFYNVSPHNWEAVFMWIPVFISPIWSMAGLSWLSERNKLNSIIDK